MQRVIKVYKKSAKIKYDCYAYDAYMQFIIGIK